MKPKNLVLISLIVAILVGCGGGSSPTAAGPADKQEVVTDAPAGSGRLAAPARPADSGDTVPNAPAAPITSVVFKPITVSSCNLSFAQLPLGDYALNSNPWGKGEIQDSTQCVGGSSVGTVIDNVALQTGVTAEFSWDWPIENASSNIKSYPEILYRPNGKGLKSIPFTEVADLTVHHDVSISATGDYNLTYDIWVDETATTDHWPHKAEVMIKVDQTWKDTPVIDTITVDGNQFDVFVQHVTSGYYNWRLLVFASKTPLLKASIPLKPFIDYLVSNNHLLQSDYISTIEFGAELKRGAGTATINSYSVTR